MEVIFYKLEGCKACEMVKPTFDRVKNEYKEFTFSEALILKDKVELYEAHAEQEDAVEYLKDENGEILKNHAGKPFKQVIKDENGLPVKTPVYSAPVFYFINPEDNEFLGKTNNPQELESLLKSMRELLNEQD